MKKGLKKLIAGAATAMALVVPVIGGSSGQEAKAWHKIDFDSWWNEVGKHHYGDEHYNTLKGSVDKVHGNSMGVMRPPSLRQ